ncbi:hypothetical protein HYFRA_00011938 [Hymenoscyphus fraxineus]|uniref:Extracellular membrane protein CFEM domain-containing protein n=1 Tax=Hymenoscyphus fraxineus TaxID=746836 RepID=A0A9N9L2Z7_9HELO|nr:hypothetical protein HYFRA_00011938 [Hymenoscyphus fraxineus]
MYFSAAKVLALAFFAGIAAAHGQLAHSCFDNDDCRSYCTTGPKTCDCSRVRFDTLGNLEMIGGQGLFSGS